jgi:hypothetical protein
MLSRIFRKLARHEIQHWALTGGIAFEMHAARLGLPAGTRALNDLDFVTPAFDSIPATLSADFLCRHIHPFDPPGKILLQLIDPESRLRIDAFRASGQMMSRAVTGDFPFGALRVVSLEDLVARAARLLLDLAECVPVASKHARDYLRFVDLANPVAIEAAWQDHRKTAHPTTFQETRHLLPDLIRTNGNLLITPEYSKNTKEVCPRCVPSSGFQLADPNVVLSMLGYC